MRIPRSLVIVAALVAVGLSWVPPARADSDLWTGARVGYYADAARPFVGGELLFRVAPSIYCNPNVEVVFRDDSYLAFSADFHYDLPHQGRAMVWLGAGLGVISINPPGPVGGHTDAALDILLGIGAAHRRVIPYVQAKVIARSNSELSLAFGMRF